MYLKDKTCSLRVRLTSLEFEYLRNLADARNSTMSTEIRNCILFHMINNDVKMDRGLKNGDK